MLSTDSLKKDIETIPDGRQSREDSTSMAQPVLMPQPASRPRPPKEDEAWAPKSDSAPMLQTLATPPPVPIAQPPKGREASEPPPRVSIPQPPKSVPPPRVFEKPPAGMPQPTKRHEAIQQRASPILPLHKATGGVTGMKKETPGYFSSLFGAISKTRDPTGSPQDRIAPNAILNAGGRADETRCHPGTREEVIGQIDKWRTEAQNGITARSIFWLSGPAGTGKTAIMQTVAESWKSRGVHAANFFFFRTDSTRNHALSLVPTLLHQIVEFYPDTRQILEGALEQTRSRGDDIFLQRNAINRQFGVLISSLRSAAISYSQPIVFLIDGLDECVQEDSQQEVLRSLDALVSQKDLPFLVLISSRVKDQITMVFKELHSMVSSIFLDSTYLPSADIRLFVIAEFDRIKRTHPLAPQDEDWPLPSDIDEIVTKSSGQFIYPSTIMRFISQSPADPRLTLAQLLGAAAGIGGTGLPFFPLDSIYTHILRQARDQRALSDILHVALVLSKPINKAVKGMLLRVLHTYNRRYTENIIEACISDVMSVVQLRRRELVFQHASFNDYLRNRTRSGKYFVDLASFSPKILPAIWEHIGKPQAVQFGVEFAQDKVESMLPDFMNTIIELEQADFGTFSNVQEMGNVFRLMYELCVKNGDVANYSRMIRRWITHYISSCSQVQALDSIPCSKKYVIMALIDREQNVKEPTPAVAKALRPSSHFDVCELTLWIGHLLQRIHTNYHSRDLDRYKRLMKKWIHLAILNKIPLKRLDTLPHAQQYFWDSKGTNSSLISDHVALNAILNSGGRPDKTRCHPGTRGEVIRRIEKWRTDAQNGVTARSIFWLSGPAGAGKTAIVQTIAESWKECGIHAANFFFFRTDATRNHPYSVVSTLLHQIFDFYPAARQKFEEIAVSKPEILTASLIEQFDTLMCNTLRSITPLFSQPIVLLIDGLDECASGETFQQQILHALDVLVSQKDLPFLVLIASRVEPDIKSTFDKLKSTVNILFLDNTLSPSEDIRLFVTAEFDMIKRTHHLAPQDEDWPSPLDIDGIVAKSSGQFIFAATAMRFISQSPADPKHSLAQVQGTAPISNTESPFAPLDAMYTHILRQAKDQKALKDILHVALVLRTPTTKVFNGMVQRILNAYDRQYTESVIGTCVIDVVSLLYLQRRQLVFHHASFDDYLQNRTRSGKYFVDLASFSPKILPAIWEHIGKAQGVQFGLDFAFSKVESMLPDLINTIIELELADFGTFSNAQGMKNVFRIIYLLCVKNDNVANYRRMIRSWITHYISLMPPDSRDKTIYDIPYSERYITMAEIDCTPDIMEPTPAIGCVLRPSSPFDVREMTLWIRDLLRRIHRNYYPYDLIRYKQLLEKWIFFAVSNGIPLTHLGRLPHAQEYLRHCMLPESANIFFKFVSYVNILYHMQ